MNIMINVHYFPTKILRFFPDSLILWGFQQISDDFEAKIIAHL